MFPLVPLVATALLFASTTGASPGLSINLLAPDALNGVQDLKISTTLTNTGDEVLRVLNHPDSIMDNLETDSFEIIGYKTGASPAFTGAIAKYSPEIAAREGGFTTLAPGESVTTIHDLANAYNFTESGADYYTFAPRSTELLIVKDDGSLESIDAEVDPVTAQVDGLLALAKVNLQKRASFPGCSAERIALTTEAYGFSGLMSKEASNYFASVIPATSRYTTWFGTEDANRRSTVASHYQKISSSDWGSFTYDCSCNRAGVFAYVYPGTPYSIWLCPVFWVVGATGTDSRSGTLIHEASHWTVYGGTRDYVYGQASAQNLAISRPANAILNADNHEYFAENTPALP